MQCQLLRALLPQCRLFLWHGWRATGQRSHHVFHACRQLLKGEFWLLSCFLIFSHRLDLQWHIAISCLWLASQLNAVSWSSCLVHTQAPATLLMSAHPCGIQLVAP